MSETIFPSRSTGTTVCACTTSCGRHLQAVGLLYHQNSHRLCGTSLATIVAGYAVCFIPFNERCNSFSATTAAIGTTRTDAGSGTTAAVATGTAVAAPYSIVVSTVSPASVIALTAIGPIGSIAAPCYDSALAHQIELTAPGQFNASTGAYPAGCLAARG